MCAQHTQTGFCVLNAQKTLRARHTGWGTLLCVRVVNWVRAHTVRTSKIVRVKLRRLLDRGQSNRLIGTRFPQMDQTKIDGFYGCHPLLFVQHIYSQSLRFQQQLIQQKKVQKKAGVNQGHF